MKALTLIAFFAAAMALMVGCQSGPKPTSYAPYFDGVFEVQPSEKTRMIADDMLELSHSMVSDVNERYRMEDPRMIFGAKLDDDGDIADGKNMVLELEFVDAGENSVSESFNTAITLRLEINSKNEVINGIMRGKPNSAIGVLAGSSTAGRVLGGKAYIMYRDNEVVMGQLQVEMNAFRINANFRALTRHR